TQLGDARDAGADYLAFGPIFATTSKSTADPVLGYERLVAARRLTEGPLVAIGGITADTAPAVLAAGADAVAIIAAVVRAPDVPRSAMRVGSKSTTSAAYPGRRSPRRSRPNVAAESPVIRCTASARLSTPSSRAYRPSTRANVP